jgi:hypothetical protein
MTLLVIGAASALLIVMVTLFVHFELSKSDSGVFAGIVAAMCVSLLLFLYGFYSFICGSRHHKLVLAIIDSISAVALAVLGIVILTHHSKISDSVETLFEEHSDSNFVTKLEKELDCTNWIGCQEKFQELYRSYRTPIGASLIILFVALMVSDFFTWKWVCNTFNTDPALDHKAMTTPFTYSRGTVTSSPSQLSHRRHVNCSKSRYVPFISENCFFKGNLIGSLAFSQNQASAFFLKLKPPGSELLEKPENSRHFLRLTPWVCATLETRRGHEPTGKDLAPVTGKCRLTYFSSKRLRGTSG